jgi:hypothetical protein
MTVKALQYEKERQAEVMRTQQVTARRAFAQSHCRVYSPDKLKCQDNCHAIRITTAASFPIALLYTVCPAAPSSCT